MGNIRKLEGVFQIKPLEKLNEHFTLAECTVCGCGKNRNYSHIGKDVIEKKLYQLDYLPIVAHIMKKEDGTGVFIGGHDYTFDEDGNWTPLTQIVGCVIADTFEFREIEEYADKVEYLVCKCILYTEHVPALLDAIYSENVWFNQSMELDVIQGRPLKEDSNYYEILDFDFLKLCLLGKSDDSEYHTEPCFISSAVYPVEFSLDEGQIVQMVDKIKEVFSACFDKRSEKGGNTGMNIEDINRVCAEYGVDPESIAIDNYMTEESLRAQLETMSSASDDGEPAAADAGESDPAPQEFSFTYNDRYEAIVEALPNTRTEDENGKVRLVVNYWLQDFDDTFAYVTRYTWDGTDETRDTGRFAYSYDEDNNTAAVTGEFEVTHVMYLTDDEKAIIDAERNELHELREYRTSAEAAAREAEYSAVLAEFEDIQEYPEYAELLEHVNDFENADALRKECCAIRGAHMKVEKQEFSFERFGLATASVKHEAKKPAANAEVEEFMERYSTK